MTRTLECKKASQLESRLANQKWLIEGLIPSNSVGIVGGQPKTNKCFMALEIAIAVASGRQRLGRFETAAKGAVLLFDGESQVLCEVQHTYLKPLESE